MNERTHRKFNNDIYIALNPFHSKVDYTSLYNLHINVS